MIDLSKIESYRENNRIEAKKALGGLPHSIWETYSAFANTLGGLLLLGVEEYRDKTLHTVDLPDPEGMAEQFWSMVNDPKTASVNILNRDNISIENVKGNRIIIIDIPRAHRFLKPVYVGGGAVYGTYKRTGEGDYHCSEDEIRAMYRDASAKTQDMLILEKYSVNCLDKQSIASYLTHTGIPGLSNEAEPLVSMGAAAYGMDGKLHPTAAGLLMFGRQKEIREVYPSYRLELKDADTGERMLSSCHGGSENVWDFYNGAVEKLSLALKEYASLPEVMPCIREALVNCLVNADYYSNRGVYIIKRRGLIVMSNPGDFRIEISGAVTGGKSDPRNGVLLQMFNRIGTGKSTGSGIPGIFKVWKDIGWSEPGIVQTIDPAAVAIYLPLSGTIFQSRNSGKSEAMRAINSQLIINYLTDHASADTRELSKQIGLRPSEVSELLKTLVNEGIATASGDVFRLKA